MLLLLELKEMLLPDAGGLKPPFFKVRLNACMAW